MRLNELFEIRNGLASTGLTIESNKGLHHLPYLRPSNTQEGTIAGWVWLRDVDEKYIYPPETLFVSTDGEGSHTHSYVSNFSFVPNSNISVLIPRRSMSLVEKLYYSLCITKNRYKFSYGRKPKGERLKNIELPKKMPHDFLKPAEKIMFEQKIQCEKFDNLILDFKNKHSILLDLNIEFIELQNIFYIDYGINLELYKFDECHYSHPSAIPFVSRTEKNNGISAYVEKQIGYEPNPAHTLSVAGGGSVLSTFYQPKPYYSGRDLYYLTPKREMSPVEMLYYATMISANKYRYSYGRQANKTLKSLLIPSIMPEHLHELNSLFK